MRIHPVDELKRRCKTATQKKVAAELGISEGYLSDLLHNKRGVGDQIVKALGMRVRYEWIRK